MYFTTDAASRSLGMDAGIHVFFLFLFLLTQCAIHWADKYDEKKVPPQQYTQLDKILEKPAKLALPMSWAAFGLITIYIIIFKVLPYILA